MSMSTPGCLEMIDQIAVRVEHTNAGDLSRWQPLLPAGFAQQALGGEDRRGFVVLVIQNGRCIRSARLRVVVRSHTYPFSTITTPVTTPENKVNPPTTPIAQPIPIRSAITPASSAPTA